MNLEPIPPMSMFAQVLMSPPDFFEVRDVKNEFMRRHVGAVNRAAAIEQWDALRKTFEKCGVRAHVLPPAPQCEDMVFTANPSFNGRSVSGERICVPSRMVFPSRRPEVERHVEWFRRRGYAIAELPKTIERFEGGGDAVWHPGRALIWAGFGQRTERRAHAALARIFGATVHSLELADARFYHLDTCFCALDERTVMIHPGGFTKDGLARIRDVFPDVVEVDEEEAAQRFACNAVGLAGKFVILQAGAPRTVRELERRGFTVLEVETGEFLKSGGSVFCMKAGVY